MPVDGATGCLGSFMRLKQQHEHLQLILSVGGGAASQTFATVAASAATRDNFGKSAKGLVDASGFQGIDSEFLQLCYNHLLRSSSRLGISFRCRARPKLSCT